MNCRARKILASRYTYEKDEGWHRRQVANVN